MKLRFGRITFVVSYPLVGLMTAVIILDRSYSVLLCFLAAVLHELGHIATLELLHSPPDTIRLTLFDIAIVDNKKALRGTRRNLAVILSGAAVNYLFAALSYIVFLSTGWKELSVFTAAHLTLGIFNSLPVCSLDGGQALNIILQRRFDPEMCDRIMKIVSLIFLFPMALWGFLLLLQTRYNFTLLLASAWLIFETLRS